MWNYIVRRTLYNIPVFLSIVFVVMLALRVNDPVSAQLGKNATQKQVELLTEEYGLDQPFVVQYVVFLRDLALIWKPIEKETGSEGSGQSDSVWKRKVTRSWDQKLPVSEMILKAIPPSMAVTIPTLFVTASIAICVALCCSVCRLLARSCSDLETNREGNRL